MIMDLIENIEKEYLKEDLPEFKSGDTVKAVSYTHLRAHETPEHRV